jgi:hypothetical protein
MIIGRHGAGVLLLAIMPTLMACASPDSDLRSAIDIRVYDSDEQRLVIHNATPEPLDVLQGRNGRAKTLAPNATLELRFRVVSLESHLRVADEPYYFRMAGPVTNRFEEMDGLKYVAASPAGAVLYFRDSFGDGEFGINLDECMGNRWETKQWGVGTHSVDLPSRVDGAMQLVCPKP